jgi:nitroimidazol reductase NimA-like FMN-containing flavoprotein (pyridoxamine 5'-phosphate oxidase superfamily)
VDDITPTKRTTVIRHRERGRYDRETVNAISDEALICHVGFSVNAQPYVLPTTHARIEDQLYLHGSAANHMLKGMKGGIPMCVTMTLLDGLVLARSAMHHSMNYRSAVILGQAQEVTDESEKRRALDALVNHVVAERASLVRPPAEQELKATLVLALRISEWSAKVRRGPPLDAEEDYALSCWAGELPLAMQPRVPVNDPRLVSGTAVPPEVSAYKRPRKLPSC